MSPMPRNPKIYHITHVKNLEGILERGGLLSDALMLQEGGPALAVGMSKIKRRRLEEIEVTCHPGTKVGEYVPFYFCPRSIMLYILHKGDHPEIDYGEGQEPIIHLEADLQEVIHWAQSKNIKWAFTYGNAGAYAVEFGCSSSGLKKLGWEAIAATDFRDGDVKERKQAEFLVYGFFPFELISRIGVYSNRIRERVTQTLLRHGQLAGVDVQVIKEWYY